MAKIIILILGVIIGGFLVVFIMQNTVMVEVVLLGFTVSMSRALMLLIVLLSGLVLGWIIKSLADLIRNNKSKEKKEGAAKSSV